jgi:hypothetical protein
MNLDLSSLPTMADYTRTSNAPPPPPQNTHGFFMGALGSGLYGGAASTAAGVAAAARAVGAPGVATNFEQSAAQNQQTADSYNNTDYSNLPWYSPTGIAYRTLQGLPMMGAALGAAALAPEALGAAGAVGAGAAALYPSMVGGNVQRARDEGQPVNDTKALALGVPEALAAGALPGYAETALAKGVTGGIFTKTLGDTAGGIAKGAAIGAVTQAGAGAVGEGLLQQMGDPSRSFASRAQDIVNSALTGATTGAVLGGAIHGLAKKPAATVSTGDMEGAVDAAVSPPAPPTQPPGPPDIPGSGVTPGQTAPGINDNLTPEQAPNEQSNQPPVAAPATPQPPLAIPPAPVVEPGNENAPASPAVGPATPQPPILPDANNPASGAFPGGRGVNDEGQARDNTAPATPQPDLPIPQPATLPGANDAPGLQRLLNAPPPPGPIRASEEPVSRPASDDEPVVTPPPLPDLSKLTGAELLDTMGSHHPDTTQGAQLMDEVGKRIADAKADPKSADDVRDILLKQDKDQATARTTAANQDTIKQAVGKKTLPSILKDPDLLGNTDALKGAIYERLSKGPPTDAFVKAAKAFNILDDDGNLTDPRMQVEPEPATPDVSAIPEGEPQASPVPSRPTLPDDHPQLPVWKTLEGLRSNLPDNLKAVLGPQIDEAQGNLANLKRGQLSKATGVINKVKAAIEGQKAIDKAKGVQTTVTPTASNDNPATAKKFNTPPPSLRDRIEQEYLKLTGGQKDTPVNLSDLRKAMPDVDRQTLDGGLAQILQGDKSASLMRQDDPRQLKPADREAAYSPAGDPFHVLWISSAADKPLTKQETMKAKQSSALKLEHVTTDGQGYHRVSIKDGTGAEVGTIDMRINGDHGKIQNIEATDSQPNQFGPTAMRSVMGQLKGMFPDLKTIGGWRTSGARTGTSTGGNDRPVVKLPEPAAPTGKIDPLHQLAIAQRLKTLRRSIQDLGNQRIPDAAEKGRQEQYDDAVGRLADAHDTALEAAKSGDMGALRQIDENHFPRELYDDHFDGAPAAVQAKIAKASSDAGEVVKSIKEATNQTGLDPRVGAPFASRMPSALDQDLTQKIADGASVRDLLGHLVQNGSSSMRKSIAARLLQTKIDPSIRFGTQEEAQSEHPTLRNVYGDYHDAFNRVRIYDQADLEHTVLEEAVHAATVKGINTDPVLAKDLQSALDAVKLHLTPDERMGHQFSNTKEFVAAALVNPDTQRFLDGITPTGSKVSIWGRIKQAIGKFLGLPKGSETMLDHVMHLGGQAMDLTDTQRSAQAATPQGLEQTTGLYARTAQDNADRIKRILDVPGGAAAVGTKMFKAALQWRHLIEIGKGSAREVPHFPQYVQAVRDEGLANDKINGPGLQASLMRQSRTAVEQKNMDKLKILTTLGIDPRRTPEQHTWLASDGTLAAKTPDIIRANNLYNELRRSKDAKGVPASAVFDAEKNVNDMHRNAEIAITARNLFNLPGYEDAGHDNTAMQRYQNLIDGTHSSPEMGSRYWGGEVEKSLATARKYVSMLDEAIPKETDPNKAAQMAERREAVKSFVADQTTKQVQLTRAPNFATRRVGDFFAAADFKGDFTPDHVRQLQGDLDKAGFGNVVLTPNGSNKSIYIRVKTEQEANALHDILKKSDVLEPKSTKMGTSAMLTRTPGLTAPWMRALIAHAERTMPTADENADQATKAAFDGYRAQHLASLERQYLNMVPESDMSKIYAKRENVQGFDGDMGAANDQRLLNSSKALSTLAYRDEIASHHYAMMQDVGALNRSQDPNIDAGVRARAAAAVNEASKRQLVRNLPVAHSAFDTIREMTHIFELGLSPIYTAHLVAQIYTNALPKLAATHGYARAITELTKAMPQALQVIKQTYSGLDRNHFIMSPDKLKGVKDKDFLLRQNNMGTFSGSSRTSAMYEGVHLHNKYHRMLHDFSGAYTLNSEMLPRLVTALAAKNLYEGKPVPATADYHDMHSFAAHAVDSTQFDWSQGLSARATSKQGVAGPASPLVAQLQGYHMRLAEMMIRNIADAKGARGPAEQAAARRFLLGHLAATAAISGTLALPGAGMAAGIYDRLADWATGDDTHDIKASYRQYLADTFGNDMGEALAHGVPRTAGIDLSDAGEDRIVPFTDLVASKQKFEDASADWAKQAMGPAYRLGTNAVLAARDLTKGDFLEAAVKFGPEFTRRVAEAYKLGAYGYTDKAGFPFGGTPSTGDVVGTAMGFTPPAEANYEEKSRTVEGLNERGDFDKQEIMTHLARAFNRQDPEGYAEWANKSTQYQMSHPGEPPPMTEFANYMRQHSNAAAIAGATGLPLNTGKRSLLARGMVGYGNANE